MAVIARLSADLTANTTRFEAGMKRSNAVMNQSKQVWSSALANGGRNFDQFGKRVNNSAQNVSVLRGELRTLAVTAASALSVQKIIQYSDTWKQLSGRLSLVVSGMSKTVSVQNELFEIAQRTRQPLTGVYNLYTRLAQAIPEAQRAQFDLLGVTESINQSLAITGEGSAQAASAILQFTQAAASGFKGSGQEINALLDSAPRLAIALQRSFGDGKKSLKELSKDGTLDLETILKSLSGVGKEGQKLREEFAKLPTTVGQAMTQLDNAFMRYIGNSAIVTSGTNAVAVSIKSLAENFDDLASVLILFAGLQGGKFLATFVASRIAMAQTAIAATAQARAINVATAAAAGNARMALAMTKAQQAAAGSIAATTIVVGRSGVAVAAATTAMGRAAAGAAILGRGLLAAFGGTVGLAITALAAGLLIVETRESDLEKTQARLNQISAKGLKLSQQLAVASGERKAALEKERDQLIRNAKTEVDAARVALNASLAKYDKIEKGGLSFTGVIPKVLQANDLEKKMAALKAAQTALADLNEEFDNSVLLGGSGGSNGDPKDTFKKIIDGLKEETQQLEIQTSMYGQKESAIKRALKMAEIQNQLSAAGISINKEQQKQLDAYLDSLQTQTHLQAEQEKQSKKLAEQEKNRQEALDQLGSTFSSAFEDAIVNGKKLSDVFKGLLQDIIKMQVRRSITEPLFGGSGIFGDLLGSIGTAIFGAPAASHATGQPNVPYDMNVRVHKGERIVPAQMNKGMTRGSGDVNLTVNNNSDSKVAAKGSKNGNDVDLEVMVDRAVAKNVSQRGSKTNQALGAYSQRTTVRR